MNFLVTGASGFAGRTLCESLRCIRDGKDRTRDFAVDEVFAFDVDTPQEKLGEYCARADFVLHFAGVNRPKDEADFMRGNRDFTAHLLTLLREAGNRCPVVFASSVQASLVGRYAGSLYGQSKLAAEELLFSHAQQTGAPVYVFRFPNLFGKWCRPGYNSAVATFCHQVAHDEPVTVNDRNASVELLYIDDLVECVFRTVTGNITRCDYDGTVPIPNDNGRFCLAQPTETVTLGQIVDMLRKFRAFPDTLRMSRLPEGSFRKKLYSCYLSHLPPQLTCVPLTPHADARGSFTELLKTSDAGQFSVNVSKPGITKGQHWHHSKWEMFIVVHGTALIEQRDLCTGETFSVTVSGDAPQAVYMLPGRTHSIRNLSDTEDLITLMWANECFDPAHPDTFFEPV